MAKGSGVIRMAAIVGAAASLAACVSYPSEPRYSTRAAPDTGAAGYPPPGTPAGQPYNPYGSQPTAPVQPTPSYEAPPPSAAPVAPVEGGVLPPTSARPYEAAPSPASAYPPRPVAPVVAGAGYQIQPGDTLSGVGRRFQTPVQTLIDLNNLGPRGAITPGQQIVLPDSAVDTGRDPYATGPSPVGVLVPNAGAVPPPPPIRSAAPRRTPSCRQVGSITWQAFCLAWSPAASATSITTPELPRRAGRDHASVRTPGSRA